MEKKYFIVKNLLFFIIGVSTIGIVSILSIFLTQHNHLEDKNEYIIERAKLMFTQKLYVNSKKMELLLDMFEMNENMIKLFKSQNKEELYLYTKPIYDKLNRNFDVTHFYFYEVDSKVLLRVHNKSYSDDLIDRVTLLQAKEKLEVTAGLEYGVSSDSITLRVVKPFIVDNELIGFVELGKEINSFTDELSMILGYPTLIMANNKAINGDKSNKYTILSNENLVMLPSNLKAQLEKGEDLNNKYIDIENRKFTILTIAFNDITKKHIAKLLILRDITIEYNTLFNLILTVSSVIVILMIIMIIIYYKQISNMHTTIEKKQQEIEELAITDELSGLYNRRCYNIKGNQSVNRAVRLGVYINFVMIDIDNFKKYNDTYGHQKGDDAIKAVATKLKDIFKRVNDYTFRLGGEEFAILFLEKDKKDISILLENLRKSIENLKIEHIKNDNYGVLTISIGAICHRANRDTTLDNLAKEADDLLYRAKKNGRNRVELVCG